MPQYDYLYLGDNARAPYGGRSFDVVYEYTRQAVGKLFSMGCPLVILGCNTASAKALRSIQQNDLPHWNSPESSLYSPSASPRRVLGVIRPTAEVIGSLTQSRHVGLLATEGTVRSESYKLEIQKLFPDIVVSGVACPLWAPIVEAGEAPRLVPTTSSRSASTSCWQRIRSSMLSSLAAPTIRYFCRRLRPMCRKAFASCRKGITSEPVCRSICSAIPTCRPAARKALRFAISPPRVPTVSRKRPASSSTTDPSRHNTSYWGKFILFPPLSILTFIFLTLTGRAPTAVLPARKHWLEGDCSSRHSELLPEHQRVK